MDEDGDKQMGEVDRISDLPDCLLLEVLLNLSTKDAVKTSLLSSRWRNLWKYVSGLDLENTDFRAYKTFVRFVDSFLDFNSESSIQKFKLFDACDFNMTRWINTVVKLKVKHIDIVDDTCDFKLPPNLYTCETLVSLKLCGSTLPSPKLVSLPCLKVLDLSTFMFTDELDLERLISRCPVLESLVIERGFCDDIQVLRVRSQSLLNFFHGADGCDDLVEDLMVVIDAPRLKCLTLTDARIASYMLINVASLVRVDIDTMFNLCFGRKFDPNDMQKRNVIRNFLGRISKVKDMVISSSTLKVLYGYSRCEPIPLFQNLSLLRVEVCNKSWEMLPVFLERCPNLKSLVVESARYSTWKRVNTLSGPRCFLASLVYVKIERPLKWEALEMKLARYLLENSTSLKKLTIRIDGYRKKEENIIFKELLAIPRLSTSCQVVVL